MSVEPGSMGSSTRTAAAMITAATVFLLSLGAVTVSCMGRSGLKNQPVGVAYTRWERCRQTHLEVLLWVSLAQEHKDSKGQSQTASKEAKPQAHVSQEGRKPQQVAPKGSLHKVMMADTPRC